VPGMRGVVPRYARLRYRGFDESGAVIDRSSRLPRARGAARMRPPGWNPLPDAHRDLSQFGFVDVLFRGRTWATNSSYWACSAASKSVSNCNTVFGLRARRPTPPARPRRARPAHDLGVVQADAVAAEHQRDRIEQAGAVARGDR